MYAGQQVCLPIGFYRGGIELHTVGNGCAEYRHSGIAYAEHHTTVLQFIDTNRHFAETRYFKIAFGGFPERVALRRLLGGGIIGLEYLAEIIVGPYAAGESIGNGIMP